MTDDCRTDPATFTAEDFKMWQSAGVLVITPKFQRRPVWKRPNKSYFIDTILRRMPVPPIYLRNTQNETKTKNVREVVDGQQRIRSVMEFMADEYRLAKNLAESAWAGKRYSDLTDEQQNVIKTYGFPIQIFQGISDRQVLEVFSRLNMYSVPLNKQELRNGKYFGLFKQLSYKLAHDYLEFWRNHKIFTENNIARMAEVELTSELLIAGNTGMQDKKGSVDTFYRDFDEEYADRGKDAKRFRDTMATIADTFANDPLTESEFHRPPMFYTLYCVVYHHMFGLPHILRKTPRRRLTTDDRDSLRDAVAHLSDIIVQAKESENDPEIKVPRKYDAFVGAVGGGQTDNIKPRTTRFNTLFEAAF